MLTDERKTHLLTILAEHGRIVAREVSESLGLSEDTIRRDLRELARAGKLKRVHGGAVPIAPANAPFAERTIIASPQKDAIGKRAAAMISPGQTIFLDGGTTALCLAAHISGELEATIVTHSPNVALALMAHPGLTIDLIGGRLFRHSVVTSGAQTLAAISRLRPDLAFIGATGIHPEHGITTGDSEEAAIKRAVIDRSGEACILCSGKKLGAVSNHRIADCNDVSAMIVADDDEARARTLLHGTGCEVIGAYS